MAADLPGVLKIVKSLRQHRNAWPFNEPVDPVALNIPDYFQVITHPMDLGTVESRLQSGYYKTVEDVVNDVRQIWENSVKYNGPEHDITKLGQALAESFENRVKQLKEKVPSAPSTVKKKSSTPGKMKSRGGGQELSYEEKRELCVNINSLEPANLGKVVQIIHKHMPDVFKGASQDTEEIEINLDALNTPTLAALQSYVESLNAADRA